MKINDIDYPYNFFILKKELFEQKITLTESNINNFTKYKVLIGKDGIFIWNEEKDKNKIIIYYRSYKNK